MPSVPRRTLSWLVRKVQFITSADGDRSAKYASCVFEHEVYLLCIYLLCCNNEIAFVLAIFIIYNNYEFSFFEVFYSIFNVV